jgi:DNA-binding NtrC family response regulator
MAPRALVVDDDVFMAKTLADLLRLKGWDVETAHSGEEAVDAATARDFDVVLMDVKMPGMDGVDAFKAMKAARPDVRVVLMTAYAAQDRIQEAERQGVVSVLSKPVDVNALLCLLTATLGHRQPVLLVDRDPVFLRTMTEVLRVRGFNVAQAEDLAHAKALMCQDQPLAVLLHINVSDATAHQAVMELHKSMPSVALILYSGKQGAAEEIAHAVPPGWVHAYLQKPFAADQVTGVLNEIRRAG